MRSILNSRIAKSAIGGSNRLALVAGISVVGDLSLKAAEVHTPHPFDVPLGVYTWLLIFGLVGWAAAKLPTLAKWGGTQEAKWKIIQSIVASLFASVLAFFLVKIAGQSDMGGFVAAGVAGYIGESFFTNEKDGRKK